MCAKQMFLVDPSKWKETSRDASSLRDGLVTTISDLDQEMKDILSNNEIDDRTKAQSYQQLLQRYILQSNKHRQRPVGRIEISQEGRSRIDKATGFMNKEDDFEVKTNSNIQKGADFETRVLKSVPTHLKNKAVLLMDYVKANPDISWDHKDQLVSGSHTIKGSNGVDLINDLLRVRKTVKPPLGWETLASTLKQSNIPKEVIGNSHRWTWMGRGDDTKLRTPSRKHQRSPSPKRLRWESLP